MFSKYEFQAERPGPHLLVFGGIHGNEPCGSRALEKLIAEFNSGKRKILKGRCTLVPICNEKAYAADKRYIDENLNRVFKRHAVADTHEKQLANRLAPLVENCDILLDLHSMESSGKAFSFLNSPTPGSEEFCRALDCEWIVEGWPELYKRFPGVPAGDTQSFADSLTKTNALIECGQNRDPAAVEVAYEALLRAFGYLGLIEETFPIKFENPIFLNLCELYFRESPEDQFVKTWMNFESIKKGELLARRANQSPVYSPCDGAIVFPNPVSALGSEWFYIATASRRAL